MVSRIINKFISSIHICEAYVTDNGSNMATSARGRTTGEVSKATFGEFIYKLRYNMKIYSGG